MVEALQAIAIICAAFPFGGLNQSVPATQRACFVTIAECFNAKTNNGTDANRAANLIACVKGVP